MAEGERLKYALRCKELLIEMLTWEWSKETKKEIMDKLEAAEFNIRRAQSNNIVV